MASAKPVEPGILQSIVKITTPLWAKSVGDVTFRIMAQTQGIKAQCLD